MDDYRPEVSAFADDPRNLLSLDARKRIHNAQWAQEAIRNKAFAAAEWAYKSQDRDSYFGAYLATSPAYREATLSGALLILQAVRAEFAALDMPRKQFWKIMSDEVEAYVNSFELTELDRRWLESEVVWPPRVERDSSIAIKEENLLSVKRVGRPPAFDVDGKEIKSIRGATPVITFARLCNLSQRKLERAEKGKATDETLVKICKYAKVKGIKITPKELIKNLHQ